MKFLPLYDKIVLIKINEEEKLGTIYLPKNDNTIIKGKVLEIGEGKLLDNGTLKKLIVKKNDIVLFKDNYNIEKYKVDNIDYYFIKESDIISLLI